VQQSTKPSLLTQGLDPGVFVGGHEAVVGLLDGLELELGLLLVGGVLVGVPLLGQLPVRLPGVRL